MQTKAQGTFVRVLGMAAAGAALLVATALSFEAPRRAVRAPEPALARLSASAMRTVSRQVFARDKQRVRGNHHIACGGRHGDA